MKYLLFLLLLTNNYSFSQPDSLKKYSYLLYSKDSGGCFIGTCFFYKRHTKTYLVTALHVVSDWNSIELKIDPAPNIFYVRLPLKQSMNDTIISIDVSDVKRDSLRKPYYERPDIYKKRFKNLKNYIINYINDFTVKFKGEIPQPDIVFSYGFGGNEDYNTCETLLTKKEEFSYGKLLHNINDKNVWPHPNGYDKINYAIDSVRATTTELKGFSGAPAFFLYKNYKIVFGGMIFGKAGMSQFIIRPKFIDKN